MNDFGEYITPLLAYKLNKEHGTHSLSWYVKRSKIDAMCDACGSQPVWKYGGTDMCFSCTTGESDASDDYELI